MLRAVPAPADSEQGFTLIEVLVTVALISIAFVGILSAVGGLVTSGVQNRNAASVEGTLRSAAAYAQSSAVPYLPCTTNYDLGAVPAPPGFSVTVTSVQYWDGNALPGAFQLTCPAAGDQGLELVTVRVATGSDLGGAFSRSLAVVKRGTP